MKATEMLKRQHRQVRKIFSEIRRAKGHARRDLLDDLDTHLRRHMLIEEAIFYPAVRDTVQSKKIEKLVGESFEEHHVVRLVLDELPTVDINDERFEAKMTVLEELIQHHVEEEEKEMFPAAEKLDVETLETLGLEMEEATSEGDEESEEPMLNGSATLTATRDAELYDDDDEDELDEEVEEEEEVRQVQRRRR